MPREWQATNCIEQKLTEGRSKRDGIKGCECRSKKAVLQHAVAEEREEVQYCRVIEQWRERMHGGRLGHEKCEWVFTDWPYAQNASLAQELLITSLIKSIMEQGN